MIAAAVLSLSAPPAAAQQPDTAAAAATRPEACPCPPLVADYPVFTTVDPPEAYERAVRSGTRSASGRPGPDYWQQRVDYRIEATLDVEESVLRGRESIRYTNDSPETLTGLPIRLYQNVFAPGVERNRAVEVTGGMRLARVAAAGRELRGLSAEELRRVPRGERPPPGYRVDGTVAQLFLPRPIEPGETMELEVSWEFRVPGAGAFRMGHIGGRVYNIAQWYPQVAVFDDVYRFDLTPYLGDGEFYLEYGTFEVEITVPRGWLVAATGELVNAAERLPEEALWRLEAALASDTAVRVVAAGQLAEAAAAGSRPAGADEETAEGTGTGTGTGEGVTWRYRAERVRDFAFAASDGYVWDAVGAEVGAERGRILVNAFYDPSLEHWREAARYSKHAVEFFSDYLFPYPYPHATAAYGPVGGMEYPMLVFIGRSAPGEPLYGVLAHEFSHEWFPMIVGSREAAYAWMDEGLTSFNEALARADFFDDPEARIGDMESYVAAARREVEAPLMRHTDHVESPFGRVVAAYTKPATLLHALRHHLGEGTFDRAYRAYAEAWSYRHPLPWDFFNLLEAETGRDLDWFWKPWFYGTDVLDQAVEDVEAAGDSVYVTVANLGGAVAPVELRVEREGGAARTLTWPPEVWAGRRRVRLGFPREGPAPVTGLALDPDRWWPDVDRSNNEWLPGAR